MSTSNLRFFLIVMTLALMTISCSREDYDVIPDVYVDFMVDLRHDPYFFNFSSVPGNSIYISPATNNLGIKAAGFDGNGIILYNAGEGEYYAYDRTCPHCYTGDPSRSVAVEIDGVFALCPHCNTNYQLLSGSPVSGPGKYPLKPYRTSLTTMGLLHVWNKGR